VVLVYNLADKNTWNVFQCFICLGSHNFLDRRSQQIQIDKQRGNGRRQQI
jgi:hypothetical protein